MVKNFRRESGQFFVPRVGLDQTSLVWVWVRKISPKNPKSPLGQKLNLFGSDQRQVGLLFTAGQGPSRQIITLINGLKVITRKLNFNQAQSILCYCLFCLPDIFISTKRSIAIVESLHYKMLRGINRDLGYIVYQQIGDTFIFVYSGLYPAAKY